MTTTLAPPSTLVAAVGQTVGVVPQIDKLVASIESLPSINSPAAPSLPADLQKTRQDAATWTTSVRPAVRSALLGVQQFSAQFDAAHAALDAALTRILAGDGGAVPAFQAALTPLQQATQAQIALVGQVQGQITGYDALMDRDLAALSGDQGKFDVAIQNDEQQIDRLNHEIHDLEHDIDKKKKELIAFSILSPLAVALAETIEKLTGKKDKDKDQLKELKKELSQTQGDLNALHDATRTLSQYTGTIQRLSGAAQGLGDGWASLDANFRVLLESEDISTFNAFTGAQLAAMQADWADLAAQAASMV